MLDIEFISIAFYGYLKFLYSIKKATHVEPTQTRWDFLETTVKHQRSTSTTRQSEREITLFIQLEINEIRCSEQRGEIFFQNFILPDLALHPRLPSLHLPPIFFSFPFSFSSFNCIASTHCRYEATGIQSKRNILETFSREWLSSNDEQDTVACMVCVHREVGGCETQCRVKVH